MIGIIGISFKSAPIEIRERFTLNEFEIINFINSLIEKKKIGKFVVLSTCNRTEIYFHLVKESRVSNFNSIIKAFIRLWNVSYETGEIKKYFYAYYDKEAVKHLFEVASGLDAMVLGEDQILGQVKEAFRISSEKDFTGAILNKLFHKAFEIGKKVRTQTAINEGASSVSSAAVELVANYFEKIEKNNVLLIGAGKTGELTLKCLLKKGAKKVLMTNRDFAKAQKLSESIYVTAVAFKDINKYVTESDIVIISTTSKEPVITGTMIKHVMLGRNKRPLLLVDISMPRNVEQNVKDIENVMLFDIDDLNDLIKKNYSKRVSEIENANKLIYKYTDDFFAWLDTLNLTPAIIALKKKFESINNHELGIYKKKISELEFQKVQKYGDLISGRYINMIIENLVLLSQNGKQLEYLQFVNELFELDKKQ
jgi:glutamyl-tRNA reductase